jgi:glutamyl/glutaminyl-tRNA synthetase
MPGGAASVSSNGNQDGIVWVSYPQLDGQWQKAPGYLVAYSANPGGPDGRTLTELWRDASPVLYAKFCPPTVAAGKVFQPIRIALTGGTVSEPVNELLHVVGKEAALKRLEAAARSVLPS